MRIVVYIAGVLIVFAVVWTLYLNHDLKEFESSFSEAPAMSTTRQETPRGAIVTESDKGSETEVDDFLEDLATEDTDSQENREITDVLVLGDMATFGHSEPDIDVETETFKETLTLNAELPKVETVVGACGENCEPSEVDFQELSEDARFAFLRKGLTKRFGDIPEVHLFVDYMERGHRNQPISQEEALRYVRATATLFPNAANKRHLQELELRVASKQTLQK